MRYSSGVEKHYIKTYETLMVNDYCVLKYLKSQDFSNLFGKKKIKLNIYTSLDIFLRNCHSF